MRNGISVGLVVSDGSLISILAVLAGFKKVTGILVFNMNKIVGIGFPI